MTATALPQPASPSLAGELAVGMRLDPLASREVIAEQLTRVRLALQAKVEQAEADVRTAAVCWPDSLPAERQAAGVARSALFAFEVYTGRLLTFWDERWRWEEAAALSERVQTALEVENQPRWTTQADLRRDRAEVIHDRARHAHLRAAAAEAAKRGGGVR